MARRNQGDADDVSLDSLLDTMTNVVAILVRDHGFPAVLFLS